MRDERRLDVPEDGPGHRPPLENVGPAVVRGDPPAVDAELERAVRDPDELPAWARQT